MSFIIGTHIIYIYIYIYKHLGAAMFEFPEIFRYGNESKAFRTIQLVSNLILKCHRRHVRNVCQSIYRSWTNFHLCDRMDLAS